MNNTKEVTQTEIKTYDLPEHWASALVNHDMSGYDISDVKDIQKFFDDNDLNGATVTTDGDPFFCRSNDALDIAGNCLEYNFLVPSPKESNTDNLSEHTQGEHKFEIVSSSDDYYKNLWGVHEIRVLDNDESFVWARRRWTSETSEKTQESLSQLQAQHRKYIIKAITDYDRLVKSNKDLVAALQAMINVYQTPKENSTAANHALNTAIKTIQNNQS